METAFNTSQVVLPVLYTLLLVAYARIFRQGPGGIAHFVRPILVGTVVLHFLSLGLRGALASSCPLNSQPTLLSLTALSIGIIWLILEVRTGERTVGIFAMTPAFVLQGIAAVQILGADPVAPEKIGFRGSLHIFSSVVGFSAVALCGVFGLLYLFLYSAIKRGRFGLFYRKMPPLETLSDLNLVATLVAFSALTVTVCAELWEHLGGVVGTPPINLSATAATVAVWLLYGVTIFAWKFLSLGRKRLAYTTLTGVLLMVGIFLGDFVSRSIGN